MRTNKNLNDELFVGIFYSFFLTEYDFFLSVIQSQTRIWLGEVLQTRLDEHLNISDLLADGELLYALAVSLYIKFYHMDDGCGILLMFL